jgi:hypothetical protein
MRFCGNKIRVYFCPKQPNPKRECKTSRYSLVRFLDELIRAKSPDPKTEAFLFFNGGPERVRTYDLQIRSLSRTEELSSRNRDENPEKRLKNSDFRAAEIAQKLRILAESCISACSANAPRPQEGEEL